MNNIPTRPGVSADDAMRALLNIADQHYTAMLRFCLVDKKKRMFTAERFCFRGSIGDWIYLGDSDDFRAIVKKHVKILGTEEFFDSPYL